MCSSDDISSLLGITFYHQITVFRKSIEYMYSRSLLETAHLNPYICCLHFKMNNGCFTTKDMQTPTPLLQKWLSWHKICEMCWNWRYAVKILFHRIAFFSYEHPKLPKSCAFFFSHKRFIDVKKRFITKKTIDAKNRCQINLDLSTNLATFEGQLIYCATFWTIWTPITQKHDVI